MWGIDTRRLTKIIRESGVMNAFITTDEAARSPPAQSCAAPMSSPARGADASNFDAYETVENGERTVVLWDFGAKENIPRELPSEPRLRGDPRARLPPPPKQMLAYEPEGVMLLTTARATRRKTRRSSRSCKKLRDCGDPGYGASAWAISCWLWPTGAKTEKLHCVGHRGANQPAVELATGTCVHHQPEPRLRGRINDCLPAGADAQLYANANDGTCEGVNYTESSRRSPSSSTRRPAAARWTPGSCLINLST